MNKYTIKLVEDKQLSYGSIYNLELVELENLKIYIKIYLKTRFIQISKSPKVTSIFFDQKLDRNLHLYINY